MSKRRGDPRFAISVVKVGLASRRFLMSDKLPPPSAGWHSFSMYDDEGRLLDWNADFAHEFAAARDQIKPGASLHDILVRSCEEIGVPPVAAACGEDAATLRRRIDSDHTVFQAPHAYDYDNDGRRLRVQINRTGLGRIVRLAHEVVVHVAHAMQRPHAPTNSSGLPAGSWVAQRDLPAANWQMKHRASDSRIAAAAGKLSRGRRPPLELAPASEANAATHFDPLTGLASRERFFDVLEAEWQRALYTQSAIAVAIIDLDLQRPFVVRYGEAAAEDMIKRVAVAMGQGIVRSTDLVARYGPKSYALMLSGASFAIAAVVAERARAAVAMLGVEHQDSPHKTVTCSVGFASTVPASDTGAAQLIEASDAALFQAKINGRNQAMGGAISSLLINR